MTGRPLPRSRLGNLIPSLVEAQALVALVPGTGDLKWAAAAAWDVARAAAQGGRRVALVDLWIEDPKLHEVVGLTPSEGIVDAFEYGVSLTKAAHEVDGVFFIAAGVYTAHAGDLFGHERWRKLHGGFRAEGALLLLYLSAGAFARLSAVPDGLLVLSPDGFEPESSIGQGIMAALERGAPLLGVVRERWTPMPATSAAAHASPRLPPDRPGARPARRRSRPVVVAATLAVGAAGSWALFARGAVPWSRGVLTPFPSAPASAPSAPSSPSSPTSSRERASERPTAPRALRAEALPWTVQLAAYGTLERALALADRLAAHDVTAFVTPVAIEGRRGATIWYRVLAGACATRDSAAAVRAALWRRGLAPKRQGDLLRAPYSLSFDGAAGRQAIRARGIPAVPWGADGALLVGAFESPDQASLAEAQLKRASIRATLVTRTRTTP
jgi:cell division septation protein DedD